ncbi:MAG: EamA family transporter RarD [Propioniciclava sp.]|uniref:EamA family transporter RarD n=1 Tax=Propioniciclava sp. TaxID=2038686 RepID=UPI0039E356E4
MPADPTPDSPAVDDGASQRRTGLITGAASYLIWGFFPLFFTALAPATPLEILAHRIVWSLVAVTFVLVALRRPWSWLRTLLTGGRLPRITAAALFIATNWLTYIWAVNNGHVVEGSLGYFINPLVNIVLGVVLFGEKMTPRARVGVLFALAGVGVIAWEHWQGLWISLVLALSFGLYGAVKKGGLLPGLEGLFVESAVLMPLALPFLLWLGWQGTGLFGVDARLTGMLVLAGVLTALPLFLFAVAASRLPFGVIGVLQYLNPTLQFLLGITVLGQHVNASYWAGLVLVWIGSVIYLTGALHPGRRRPA